MATNVRATTVIPPNFDELVASADAVFTGDVLGVRGQWEGEGANRRIFSSVTFEVLRVMKGKATTPYTLRMLGGTVGTRTLEVSDVPKFATGDRVVVFVKDNGIQFFPAVGVMHGVYRLTRPGSSATPEKVLDHAGRPLLAVEEIGQDAAVREALRRSALSHNPDAGLTREQFEARISERAASLLP